MLVYRYLSSAESLLGLENNVTMEIICGNEKAAESQAKWSHCMLLTRLPNGVDKSIHIDTK